MREFSDSRRTGSQSKKNNCYLREKISQKHQCYWVNSLGMGVKQKFPHVIFHLASLNTKKNLVFLVYLSCKVSFFAARKTMPTYIKTSENIWLWCLQSSPLKVGLGAHLHSPYMTRHKFSRCCLQRKDNTQNRSLQFLLHFVHKSTDQ